LKILEFFEFSFPLNQEEVVLIALFEILILKRETFTTFFCFVKAVDVKLRSLKKYLSDERVEVAMPEILRKNFLAEFVRIDKMHLCAIMIPVYDLRIGLQDIKIITFIISVSFTINSDSMSFEDCIIVLSEVK
jgi:hypothetical protein